MEKNVTEIKNHIRELLNKSRVIMQDSFQALAEEEYTEAVELAKESKRLYNLAEELQEMTIVISKKYDVL